MIGTTDSARLTFVALAEHARGLGATNPCGLFAALLRRQCWHYITDRDEDAASARLKQYWYGREGPRLAAPPPRAAPPLISKDAFMVRELQRELARAGFQGDAFAGVHRALSRVDSGPVGPGRRGTHHGPAGLATRHCRHVSDRGCTGVGHDLGSLAAPMVAAALPGTKATRGRRRSL